MTKRVKLAAGSPSSPLRRRDQDAEEWETEEEGLIPGLPDHIAHLCFAKLHPPLLYHVCSTWRRLIYSPLFPPFLSLYFLGTSSSDLINHRQRVKHGSPISTPIELINFDPVSARWTSVPPPVDHDSEFLIRHPSFLSRNLPIQSVAVDNKLVLLTATSQRLLPALPSPLIFSPIGRTWYHGPPITSPRRWCAAGVLDGAVFLASGIGSRFSSDVARSAEKWDLRSGNWNWERAGSLKDGRFCRDAIDAVGWRGKICMVNVKGDAAKDGAVYDLERDAWDEMPEGMKAGWRGPAAAMGEEEIYVVDEKKGVLRRYDDDCDGWVDVFDSELFKKAQHVAAAGGKVCVVCGGASPGVLVVDVAAPSPRMYVVDFPAGFSPLAVHILPRMSNR